jgi:ribosomal protein S12 methylthiotransferase accessory factor
VTTLERALAAGRACGVTRLADVTRLDSIGVSVFQAIRPWGRALSVHQGKALAPEAAKIGALMEAIESDHAETFEGDQRPGTFESLPRGERLPTLADCARERASPPGDNEPLTWVAAERLTDGRPLWVPFDVVSLDFTRQGNVRLDRSSNGLGAGLDREAAMVTALLEVVERDAVHVWRDRPIERRSLHLIDTASVPYDWFRDLEGRLGEARLNLSIYRVPAIISFPVFMAELTERTGDGRRRRAARGAACRPSIEAALQRSVVECAQSRLTDISGVRDDILHGEPDEDSCGGFGLAFPLPPHLRALSWDAIGSSYPDRSATRSSELANLLALAGFPEAAIVDLSPPARDAHVVKAIIPGLASFERGRRSRREAS